MCVRLPRNDSGGEAVHAHGTKGPAGWIGGVFNGSWGARLRSHQSMNGMRQPPLPSSRHLRVRQGTSASASSTGQVKASYMSARRVGGSRRWPARHNHQVAPRGCLAWGCSRPLQGKVCRGPTSAEPWHLQSAVARPGDSWGLHRQTRKGLGRSFLRGRVHGPCSPMSLAVRLDP